MKQRDSTPAMMTAVMIPDIAVMLPDSMLPITERRAIAQAMPRIIFKVKRVFITEGVARTFEI